MKKIIDIFLFLNKISSAFVIRVLLLALVFYTFLALNDVIHYGSIKSIFLAYKLENTINSKVEKIKDKKKTELINFANFSQKNKFNKVCLINPTYNGERYELEKIPEINPYRFYYWIDKAVSKKANTLIFLMQENGGLIPLFIHSGNVDNNLSIECTPRNIHNLILNIELDSNLKLTEK